MPTKPAKPIFSVTWSDHGTPHSEPFVSIYQAIDRARELSLIHHTAILVETQVRYLYARFEGGAQTLPRTRPILPGSTE